MENSEFSPNRVKDVYIYIYIYIFSYTLDKKKRKRETKPAETKICHRQITH